MKMSDLKPKHWIAIKFSTEESNETKIIHECESIRDDPKCELVEQRPKKKTLKKSQKEVKWNRNM